MAQVPQAGSHRTGGYHVGRSALLPINRVTESPSLRGAERAGICYFLLGGFLPPFFVPQAIGPPWLSCCKNNNLLAKFSATNALSS